MVSQFTRIDPPPPPPTLRMRDLGAVEIFKNFGNMLVAFFYFIFVQFMQFPVFDLQLANYAVQPFICVWIIKFSP